jgi:putative heme iron utilization protein
MLHIETGHLITKDVERLDAKGVRFVAEDGRTMFEVHVGKDGASIEVRSVDVTRVGNVLYDSKLAACPNASNSLTIRVCRYDA